MSISQSDIPNAIIGGILCSLSTTLFLFTHHHRLNLSDILWAMTSFRQKWLPEYMPLVSGIFLVSGILFNSLQYNTMSGISPYGDRQLILARTSMYGFAFGGFCIGLGSKFAKGDLIYHGFIGVARKSLNSICIFVLMMVFGFLWSWLMGWGYIGFFSNSEVNPLMEFMHTASANITIVLSVVLLAVSFCLFKKVIEDKKEILKKIGGSFISGVLIGLGFLICGLSNRSKLFESLTPTTSWNPLLLIFLSVNIILNLITYHLIFRKLIQIDDEAQSNDDNASNVLFGKLETADPITVKCLIGAILFGSGWGIAGLDLTTYFIHSAIFSIPVVIIFGGFLILGTMIGDALE